MVPSPQIYFWEHGIVPIGADFDAHRLGFDGAAQAHRHLHLGPMSPTTACRAGMLFSHPWANRLAALTEGTQQPANPSGHYDIHT